MHHARQAVILGSGARIAYDIIPVEDIFHAKLYTAALIELIAGNKVYRAANRPQPLALSVVNMPVSAALNLASWYLMPALYCSRANLRSHTPFFIFYP